MNRQMAFAAACYGADALTIGAYRASCAVVLEHGSLWTVPELWKTPRPRFPQLLGRRTERAAHNGPQAFISSF